MVFPFLASKLLLSWADCDPFLNIALVIKANPSLLACSIARDLIMEPHQGYKINKVAYLYNCLGAFKYSTKYEGLER